MSGRTAGSTGAVEAAAEVSMVGAVVAWAVVGSGMGLGVVADSETASGGAAGSEEDFFPDGQREK